MRFKAVGQHFSTFHLPTNRAVKVEIVMLIFKCPPCPDSHNKILLHSFSTNVKERKGGVGILAQHGSARREEKAPQGPKREILSMI